MHCVVINKIKGIYMLRHIIYDINKNDSLDFIKNITWIIIKHQQMNFIYVKQKQRYQIFYQH